MKFPVGEGGGGAVTFSDDSTWAAITIVADAAEAQANTRARRPNQNSVTLVNLATGEKTTIAKIRRFAFAGEAGGWIALHRYGATPAHGRRSGGPRAGRAAVPPPPGGGRGGATPPRDTAPRGTRPDPARPQDRLRALHRQRLRVRLQQERPLPRARHRRGRSDRQRHPDPRHADRRDHAARDRQPAFYERHGVDGRRRRADRASRARTIASTASACSASSATPASTPAAPKRTAYDPSEGQGVPGRATASAPTARRSGPKRATRSSSASRS